VPPEALPEEALSIVARVFLVLAAAQQVAALLTTHREVEAGLAGKVVPAVAVPVGILVLVVTAVMITVRELLPLAVVAVAAAEELLVLVITVLVVAVALGLPTVREVTVLEAGRVLAVAVVPPVVLETPVQPHVAVAEAVMAGAMVAVVVLVWRLLALTKVGLGPPV
jgi:hypothetical protein